MDCLICTSPGVDFYYRWIYSYLVYRRQHGKGASISEISRATLLSRNTVAKLLKERLLPRRKLLKGQSPDTALGLGLAYTRSGKCYARPSRDFAHRSTGKGKWYKRLAFFPVKVDRKPIDACLFGLVRSLLGRQNKKNQDKDNKALAAQNDQGLATLLGLHPRTIGAALIALAKAKVIETDRPAKRHHRERYRITVVKSEVETAPEVAKPKKDITPLRKAAHDAHVDDWLIDQRIIPAMRWAEVGDQPAIALLPKAQAIHERTGTGNTCGFVWEKLIRDERPPDCDRLRQNAEDAIRDQSIRQMEGQANARSCQQEEKHEEWKKDSDERHRLSLGLRPHCHLPEETPEGVAARYKIADDIVKCCNHDDIKAYLAAHRNPPHEKFRQWTDFEKRPKLAVEIIEEKEDDLTPRGVVPAEDEVVLADDFWEKLDAADRGS